MNDMFDDGLKAKLEFYGFKEEVAKDDFEIALKAAKHILTTRGGLFVSGEPGCGKTTFLKALRSILQYSSYIDCGNTMQVVNFASQQMQIDICSSNLIIDDIGSEVIYNDFGVNRNLIGEVITRFYSRKQSSNGYVIVISTNLNGEEFINRYGARVFSRIKELCSFVKFTGEDKRKVKVIQ